MSDRRSAQSSAVSVRASAVALALDVLCVVIFAAIGRGSHARAATLSGLVETAWPFAAALAIMWAVTMAWKRPFAALTTGIPVWIGTVALGMVFRALVGQGTAVPFIIVATLTLLLVLVGWRLVLALVRKIRST